MKANLIILGVSLFASVALAEPAYLDCKVSSKTESKAFAVKLDESTGKITQTSDKGEAFNAEGFFAPNTVSYQDVIIWDDIKIILKYDIDRTSLKISETSIIGPLDKEFADKVPTTTETAKGTCSIAKVENRKI